MTILELYEYAKERNILNYNIEVQNDSSGKTLLLMMKLYMIRAPIGIHGMYVRSDTEKKTMAYSALECAIWMRNFCRKGILNEIKRR